MFKINHISLFQYRNYIDTGFEFTERIISFCGSNGIGKTNLLDAIYTLCFSRSYFNKSDNLSVSEGKLGFSLKASFEKNNEIFPVSLILRENNKKELWVDNSPVSPFSLHIGKLPIVFIAPDDVELITGTSEQRRSFMDAILSQMDPEYLRNLIRYNKVLQERNKYLKQCSIQQQVDHTLLDSFDEQLIVLGIQIIDKRVAFFETTIPSIQELYAFISGEKEKPILRFIPSAVSETYKNQMVNARQKDLITQRTSVGIHKDELDISMNNVQFKQIASQGQKKSLLFALKLAEFITLKSHFDFDPILLLDDIFEKLDQHRLSKLLEWVCIKNQGQVFLTDSHQDRIEQSLDDISVPFQLIMLA